MENCTFNHMQRPQDPSHEPVEELQKLENTLKQPLKDPRQQIGAGTVALPTIPWHHRDGADSAAAGCVEAILRQGTKPLSIFTSWEGKASC